jgi:flagellar biosynthesis/type III secretory pathway protein FliH
LSRRVLRGPASDHAKPFEGALHSVAETQAALIQQGRATGGGRLARIREAAKKEGFDKGYTAGLIVGAEEAKATAQAQYSREIAQFCQDLDRAGESVREAVNQWVEETEEGLADVAMDLVRRLLHHELSVSRESALVWAREAVACVVNSERIRIRVNPFDTAILEAHKAEIMESAAAVRKVEVVADGSILAGCIVEADGGIVDARAEAALERMQEALSEAA